MNTKYIKSLVEDFPDFPQKGIIFKDISPLLANTEAFAFTINKMSLEARKMQADKIIAIDARGFIFASAIAYKLKLPLVIARKKGKLPGNVKSKAYGYEYSQAELAVQTARISQGDRIIVVDDVLATGNTVAAVVEIVNQLQAKTVGCLFFGEIVFLGGRKLLSVKLAQQKAAIKSIIKF